MKLVRQPPESNQCGQACVATLAGISLEEAIMLCRTKGKTKTKVLIAALGCMGIETALKLKRGFPTGGTAILKYTWKKWSHWVVWSHGKFYDPDNGTTNYPPLWLRDTRVTSYLGIK